MNRNSTNCICPRIYLCVVVKEHPELFRLELFRPDPVRSGKVSSASGCLGREPAGDPATALLRPAEKVVGVTGVEPVTLRLSSACSNQLSYTPVNLVELRRFELLTYSLQSYRSTN